MADETTPAPETTPEPAAPAPESAAPAEETTSATEGQETKSFLSTVAEDAAPENPAADSTVADAKDAAPEAEKSADEDYAFDIPEGVSLDEEALAEFRTVAREQRLSKDGAQALVNLGVKLSQRWAAQFEEAVAAARAAHRAEIEADPLFTGPDQDANRAAVVRARRLVKDVEGLNDLLDKHGLGDHPAIVKAFVLFGRALSEDTVLGAQARAPTPELPLYARLYRS